MHIYQGRSHPLKSGEACINWILASFTALVWLCIFTWILIFGVQWQGYWRYSDDREQGSMQHAAMLIAQNVDSAEDYQLSTLKCTLNIAIWTVLYKYYARNDLLWTLLLMLLSILCKPIGFCKSLGSNCSGHFFNASRISFALIVST